MQASSRDDRAAATGDAWPADLRPGPPAAEAGASAGRGIGAWLRRVPIDDPVDRRNAPALQVVLLLLAVPTALMWAYRAAFIPSPWRPGELVAMTMSLANSALALSGVWLIRHGHFQWAIRQTLAALALGTIYAYATQGTAPQAFEEPLLVAWIVLAGLMIGRGALWLMSAAVMLAFLAGGNFDARAGIGLEVEPMTVVMLVASKAAIFLVVAVIVDRALVALRESLREASCRGDALAAANRRLEAEIAERERAEADLVQSRKVEAVGRLASGIAHDFNHLLSLILGYASMGRKSTGGGDTEAFAGVEAAARRGMAITSRLLDFSRPAPLRVESFDVVAALRDLAPLLRQILDPAVRIRHDYAGAAHTVAFDRARFDLIVLNIAANAGQAMPDGGEFRLGVAPAAGGDQVEITLSDTGHGMDERVKSRLFEPFFTTRAGGQGIGLGLSVAHGILAAHGGGIDVESAPGEGATFRVRLPSGPAAGQH